MPGLALPSGRRGDGTSGHCPPLVAESLREPPSGPGPKQDGRSRELEKPRRHSEGESRVRGRLGWAPTHSTTLWTGRGMPLPGESAAMAATLSTSGPERTHRPVICHCSGATHSGGALCSGITPAGHGDPTGCPGIEPGSAAYKANPLLTRLSLHPRETISKGKHRMGGGGGAGPGGGKKGPWKSRLRRRCLLWPILNSPPPRMPVWAAAKKEQAGKGERGAWGATQKLCWIPGCPASP